MEQFSQVILVASVLAGLVGIFVALWIARRSHTRRGWFLIVTSAALVILLRLVDASGGTPPAVYPWGDALVWVATLLVPILFVLGLLDVGGIFPLENQTRLLRRRRLLEMEALNATAIALQRATTEEEIFRAVGDEWARLGSWTGFLFFSEDQLYAELRYLSAPRPGDVEPLRRRAAPQSSTLRSPLAHLPPAFREVQAGEAAYLPRLDLKEVQNDLVDSLRRAGQGKALLAPLYVGTGPVVGALVLLSDRWEREDLPGAVLLARQVSAALQTVRTHSRARRHRRAILQHLARISQRITTSSGSGDPLTTVCQMLVDQVGYPMAWVVLRDSDTDSTSLVAHAGCGHAGPPLTLTRLGEEGASAPPSAQAIWSGRTYVWQSQHDEPIAAPWEAALREMGCRSLAALPLGHGPDTWGALNVASEDRHAFEEDTGPILEMLANQVAATVRHTRAYAALTEERQRLSLLYEVAREVNSSLEISEVLSRAVERVATALEARGAWLFLLDEDGKRLRLKAMNGLDAPVEVLDRHLNLRVGEGLTGWVAESGQPAIVADVTQDSRWLYVEEADRGVHSVICVPLVSEGQVIGTLSATHSSPGQFSEEHLRLLNALAQQVTVAIENARLYRRLETHARAQARLSGQLRNLQDITQAMIGTLNPQEVLEVVAEGAVTQLGYSIALVCNYDREEETFHLATFYPRDTRRLKAVKILGADLMELDFPLDLRQKPEQALLLEGGYHITSSLADFISPAVPEEQAEKLQALYNVRAFCTVPMRSKGHLVGAIVVGTEQPAFTREELEALHLTAAQAAVAMENAQLYEREQAGRRIADTLLAASAALSSTLDLKRVLDLVLQQLEAVIPYSGALILLKDEEGPLLRTVAARGEMDEDIHRFQLRADRNSVYQEMEATRRPVLIADVTADSRWERPSQTRNARAWIGAPLIARGRTIGQLAVFHHMPGFYSPAHSALLLGFANQAAAAIENARLYDQLRAQMEELHKAQTRLIQTEKLSAIGQLVAGVAHELNNPLTSVLGYTQVLLKREEMADTARKDLKRIATQAQRAAAIVRNLLDFAREQPPAKKWINIHDLLERTLALRAYELEVSNIAVVRDYGRDVPGTMADPQQMQQVFLNIILNAEQAMMEGNGGGCLIVRTRCRTLPSQREEDRPRRVVRVEFQDDGPGIPRDVLPRVFDPFFTTKEVGHGTGLGLSIAYGYVAEHEGQIWAENNPPPGKGCTFVVELPVVAPRPRKAEEEEAPPARQEPVLPARGIGGRILIVEDEETVAELYQRVLTELGHEVRLARDGGEALQLLNEHPADLIIADIKMPGMDGVTFYEELQSRHPSLARRMIFITGDAVSGETRRFLENCRQPHMVKPVDLDELAHLVWEMTQKRVGSRSQGRED